MSRHHSVEKVREVKRKLSYMRADAPPKGSLRTRNSQDFSSPNQRKSSKSPSFYDVLLNDEKFNDLKASFKQQLSPGASTSSKRFEFEATSSEQSNYHLNNHSHTNSSFDSTNNSHGSTTITQTHTISPPHRTAQNVLTVTHSPEHKLHDNLEEHPLVRELSQRGLTQSCKKRKTQSDVKREVESKTLFKS